MKAMEFIDSVVPRGGHYCILGIKNKQVKQTFCTTLTEVNETIKSLLSSQNNVYFGLASYIDGASRKQNNVEKLKSFWLDLDCSTDPEKLSRKLAFRDKVEAMSALRELIDDVGLPEPTVVDSGGGYHVYWILDNELTREQWEPVARSFKRLCLHREMAIDPQVPADSARVLRVPNTINFKRNAKVQFAVGIPIPAPIALSEFEAPLRAMCDSLGLNNPFKLALGPQREMDETTKHLMGNRTQKFSILAKKSLSGVGCAQIKFALEDKEHVSYMEWTGALSMAVRCEDGATAIHKLSSGCSSYDPDVTEFKAQEFNNPENGGPRKCEWYLDNHSSRCEGCSHKGKITSPLQLASVVIESTAESVEIPAQVDDAPEPTPAPTQIVVKSTSIAIPPLPQPYFRGANGGIYTRVKSADGVTDVELPIYENDLFVVKRVRDPIDGEVLLMNLILPLDGLQEFFIPLKNIASADKLRDALSHYGVAADRKRMELIMGYIIASNKELQRRMKLEHSRSQFGWHDKNTNFVIGTREIGRNGDKYSPPSTHTGNLATFLEPHGDYETWKTVMRTLGRPGWESHQLVALAGFGAPLMTFTSDAGLLVNMVNNESGTGKTLVQHFINSIYGNTKQLMLRKIDTLASRYQRAGVMNNLPVCMDEITNMTPIDFSDMAYSFSEGRGRNRLEATQNKERANLTWWKTIGVTSSNAWMADKLTVNKATADGELHRIFEVKIAKPEELDPNFAQSLGTILEDNYGHAGDIYLHAIATDLQGTLAVMSKVRKSLNARIGTKSKERVWVSVFTSMIAGGLIARSLGIIDWDIRALTDLLVRIVEERRGEAVEAQLDFANVLGEFLSENKGAILQINGSTDLRSGLPQAPIYNPTVKIVARYEPDTNLLYVITSAFKRYCESRQIPYQAASVCDTDTLKFKEKRNARVMTGTGIQGSAVACLVYTGTLNLDTEVLDEAAA